MTRRGKAVCTIDGCDEVVAGRDVCNTHYATLRSRLMAYGKWVPDKLPAEPVRARILELRDAGIGMPRLGELTGIHHESLYKICHHGKWVTHNTWDAVMGLVVLRAWEVAADMANVDATGTRRRMRALAAIGHRIDHLNGQLGLERSALSKVISGQQARVTASRARAVAALYEQLWDRPGTDARTARMAASKGWHAPMWWDDIDDPNETPTVDRRRVSSAEQIADLQSIGCHDITDMADRLGIKPESVKQALVRMRAQSRVELDEFASAS